MKKKTLITTLILFFFTTLISATPIINADEMFFADFYVVDARGTPLNGVEEFTTITKLSTPKATGMQPALHSSQTKETPITLGKPHTKTLPKAATFMYQTTTTP